VPWIGVLTERVRSHLWPIPALAAAAAVALALVLSTVGRAGSGSWAVDPQAGRGLLQMLAGSSLTVVALVFSLHVVALQLAASQYSPRLLRTYARDWAIQSSLAVLIGTFSFCLVTLATFGSGDETPQASLTLAVLLGLACVAALVGVVSHIVASLRVETMMAELHADADRVISDWIGRPRVGAEPALADVADLAGAPALLRARRPGFVQAVDWERLARWAQGSGSRVRVDVVAGQHVLDGDALARVWGCEQSELDETGMATAVLVGHERTPDQDPALGLVQLVDIALRALSPGINDPTTALHAIGHLTSLLATLASGATDTDLVTAGPDGSPRVWGAGRSLADFLLQTVHPVVRAAADDPDVLMAVAGLLGEVRSAPGPVDTQAVDDTLDYVQRHARSRVADDADRARVESAIAAARAR
jgi:uncharacterized membrane protein